MTGAGGLDPVPPGGLFAVHEAGDGNAINRRQTQLLYLGRVAVRFPRRGLNLNPPAKLTRRAFLWAAGDTSLQAKR